jgi:hypothetical protein
MTTTAVPAARSTDEAARLRSYGLVGAIASLVGAACAVLIIAWEPMVAEERFSYPFDATWYAVAQSFFAVQHVAMLPLFVGLLVLERRYPSRALRIGIWIALVGQLLLTAMELVAIGAADAMLTDSTGQLVGGLYSVPMILLGVGPVVAGVGALRAGLFAGPARWLLLALGGYVFAVMFPAVFGPMVAGRIAIGVWLLGFAALGLVMRSTAQSSAQSSVQSSGASPESSVSPSITTTA